MRRLTLNAQPDLFGDLPAANQDGQHGGLEIKFPALIGPQPRILKAVHSGLYREVTYTAPRGNAKTWIAARAVADKIWPSSEYYEKGKECILVSGSLEQARLVFAELKNWLEPTGMYSWKDSQNSVGVRHKTHGTSCRAISSNGNTALGLGANQTIVVADEPGSWVVRGGTALKEALQGALGKPGSTMVIFWIGTVAPAHAIWWPKMCAAEDTRRTKVFAWSASDKKWRQKRELLRVNPVLSKFDDSLEQLLENWEKAKADPDYATYFKRWHMNMNEPQKHEMLLDVKRIEALSERVVAERGEKFWLGLDLGDNIAWSGAVAAFEGGRIECFALCAGLPSIKEREQEDGKAEGTYQELVDLGLLHLVEGKHTVDPADVVAMCKAKWGTPQGVVADRFRQRKLEDANSGWPIEWRVSQWSGSTYDIEALREYAADGPMSVDPDCWPLLALSIADARVQPEKGGFVKMVKKDTHNTGRDDVANALVLVAGLVKRAQAGGSKVPVIGSLDPKEGNPLAENEGQGNEHSQGTAGNIFIAALGET